MSVSLLACILLSITVFMLETMPELQSIPEEVWDAFEIMCSLIFTVEYLTRLLVCDVWPDYSMLKFVRVPMNIVDLFAILPFYFHLALVQFEVVKALGVLRIVRLIRIFRIFKLGRYSSGLQLMIVALKNSSQALWVLMFFLSIGVVLFSSAIYYVEKMGCPDKDEIMRTVAIDGSGRSALVHYIEECHSTPFASQYGLCCVEPDLDAALDFPTIMAAFWWAIVTMTTVGFGDVGPRTDAGRIVGAITMLSGILLIALPIAIVGRKFQEAYEDFADTSGVPAPDLPVKSHKLGSSGGPSLSEMSRRMRIMRCPDAATSRLVHELAADFEEISDVQNEILSMESYEQKKQMQVLEHFNVTLSYLCKAHTGSEASASADAQ